MLVFWEYLQPPHDYPYYLFIPDPKSKKDKVKLQIAHICQKVNFLIMKIFDSDTPSEVAK